MDEGAVQHVIPYVRAMEDLSINDIAINQDKNQLNCQDRIFIPNFA